MQNIALKWSILLVIFLLPFTSSIRAQVVYTPSDSLIFENYISNLSPYRHEPIHEIVIRTAKHFLNAPYAAGTLEGNEKERLVINLREFDCTTFVESCIALSLTLKSDNPDFSVFCDKLKSIRYRDGQIEDYTSRLHYVTDWIYNNSENGIVKDITQELGGTRKEENIDYMSVHADSYEGLANNNELQKKIIKIEAELNKRADSYVIHKTLVNEIKDLCKNGDIVAFSTGIPGLDFSHIGFVYFEKGKLTFIHASSRAKKVIIEPSSLFDYCRNSRQCHGIVLVRLNE